MKKLVFLLLFFVSIPSFAARQFDVEVILFERNQSPDTLSEQWPEHVAAIDYSQAHTTDDEVYLEEKGVTLLDPSEYQLNEQYQTLEKHAGFKPMLHVAWRQGDEPEANSPVFKFALGNDFSDQFNPDGTVISEQDDNVNKSAEVITPSTTLNDASTSDDDSTELAVNPALKELEGTIQVYVQHYLFVNADFNLHQPSEKQTIIGSTILDNTAPNTTAEEGSNEDLAPVSTISDTDAAVVTDNMDNTNSNTVAVGTLQQIENQYKTETFLKSFKFKQNQRMRSSETHYLDNPLIGMIIQVRKVDEEKVDQTDTAAAKTTTINN
ncbi:peptidoglycan binding protein CsiV [Vibrio sp. SS-MA-C1-2]|uniref:peptidoglycan binding protein CsiV n=1 Tax=Vibrio sp. SS-MA-C1-2 TaxID=2908646 RepID=UPI001F463538|nr:peptidoglycan binding protein CsiV [Vibrio sp. SS-MA-C1-2]UJF17432.1 peptidoglycan binding protein CsiV [Vibrio sp. SS-MA-C1-2]